MRHQKVCQFWPVRFGFQLSAGEGRGQRLETGLTVRFTHPRSTPHHKPRPGRIKAHRHRGKHHRGLDYPFSSYHHSYY